MAAPPARVAAALFRLDDNQLGLTDLRGGGLLLHDVGANPTSPASCAWHAATQNVHDALCELMLPYKDADPAKSCEG